MAAPLTGRFVFRVAGVARTYRRWKDVPLAFEEVIAFQPDIPLPPHTPEQHAEIERWQARLRWLLEGAYASRTRDR
jgi:hypothetical protein